MALSRNDTNNVPLSLTVCLASDLLELRHTIPEVLKTNDWLEGCKTEIEFVGPNCTDHPLDVMIPELSGLNACLFWVH